MLTIEWTRRLTREIGDLPRLTRLGLLLMVLAGVLGVVIDFVAGDHSGHSGDEHAAHLAGIVGMVLVLAGLVMHAARRHLNRRRSAARIGGTRNATR